MTLVPKDVYIKYFVLYIHRWCCTYLFIQIDIYGINDAGDDPHRRDLMTRQFRKGRPRRKKGQQAPTGTRPKEWRKKYTNDEDDVDDNEVKGWIGFALLAFVIIVIAVFVLVVFVSCAIEGAEWQDGTLDTDDPPTIGEVVESDSSVRHCTGGLPFCDCETDADCPEEYICSDRYGSLSCVGPECTPDDEEGIYSDCDDDERCSFDRCYEGRCFYTQWTHIPECYGESSCYVDDDCEAPPGFEPGPCVAYGCFLPSGVCGAVVLDGESCSAGLGVCDPDGVCR